MCFTSSRDDSASAGASESTFDSESLMNKTKYVKPEERKHIKEPTFLIIGAGAAGIACAVTLVKGGFKNVNIIEAEQRIGGRIYTTPFGDGVVEMGAQWCHGQRNNIVYETVHGKTSLNTSSKIYGNFACMRSDGEVVSHEIVKKLKRILAKIFGMSRTELARYDGTLGEYLTKHFYRILDAEHGDINREIAREFFENFMKIERSETSAGLEEISAKGFHAHETCDGDYLLQFEEGYLQFLRILMEADEHQNEYGILQDKILLGMRVKRIYWDRPDFQVEVICEDLNISLLVDHVIVTVSLGVLKQNARKMFDPELPAFKLNAIDGVGFGTIMKIYLEFPEQFWGTNWTGLIMLWRQNDLTELRKSTRAWLENIYGFYCVPNNPKLLEGWLVGPDITTVEVMPEQQVIEGCMFLLNLFLPQFNIPNPVRTIRSSWNTNPSFCGSFSFRSLTTEQMGASAEELRQPVTVLADLASNVPGSQFNEGLSIKPVVQFAGEATHEHYFGTVHGAVETGIEEAKRLQGYYSVYL